MRSFALTAIVASFAGFVASQAIDPDSVSLSTRDSWCSDQKTTCPLLCLQITNSASTTANDCDPTSLDWHCVCNNGQTPNETEYSLTIPFHICQEYGNQCVAKCGQNNACSNTCRTQYTCGAADPSKPNSTTTSSSSTSGTASSSASGTGSFNSFGGGKNAASGLQLGQSLGLGVVAAGLMAGFAIAL